MIWRKSNQPIVSIPILSSLIFSKKYPLLWNASLCIRSIQLSTCIDVLPQQCDGASARAVNTRLLLLFPLSARPISLSHSPPLSLSKHRPAACDFPIYVSAQDTAGFCVLHNFYANRLFTGAHQNILPAWFVFLFSGLPIAYWCAWYFVNVRIESEEEQTVFYVSAVQSLEASPTITQARYQASNLVNWSVAFLWWYLFSHCFQWFSVRIEI